MRCEIVAIGTELLLGQIVDTNSSFIGERLADSGIDCNFAVKVGDNLGRIVQALRDALARSEAVIACGGLGPTQDDITRQAIATVMNVELVRDEALAEAIRQMFASHGRRMPDSNLSQADVPAGATPIPQRRGTAPGLICPVGHKVVYAVPGVPHEMREMVERAVLPDLRARAAARGEEAVIRSRTLRTWGLAESALGETLAGRIDELDQARRQGIAAAPTIAFLASGIEGLKVRLTVKASSEREALAALAAEEGEVRKLLGDIVFGVDDESVESAAAAKLCAAGLSLGVAESLTGGIVAARLVNIPGTSGWFRGAVVAYHTAVKTGVLGVPEGMPVVSADCAVAMAEGVRKVVGSDVGLSTTGVAGPDEQEGKPVGTVFIGIAMPGGRSEAVALTLPGARDQVRQYASISAIDLLRRRLA